VAGLCAVISGTFIHHPAKNTKKKWYASRRLHDFADVSAQTAQSSGSDPFSTSNGPQRSQISRYPQAFVDTLDSLKVRKTVRGQCDSFSSRGGGRVGTASEWES